MKILGKIPHGYFYVACSGGSDSMVLVDFLLRYPQNKFGLAYFNHGTEACDKAQSFVRNFANTHELDCIFRHISRVKDKNESTEEYWRNERYNFLEKLELPVLTAHQLDDVVETWIFSSLRGMPKLIPYRRNNVFRPLLMVSKSDINKWIKRNGLEYINDPTNVDLNFDRNFIRNVMMPNVLRINPGIHKTICKKVLKEFDDKDTF